jgi:outer membrane protein TolC
MINSILKKQKTVFTYILTFFVGWSGMAQQPVGQRQPDIKELVQRAINKSQQLKIREAQVEKARLDKAKAYEAYLPKVNIEANYTRLNDDLRFSDDFETLLGNTQRLLIKEGAAMQMAALPSTMVPDAYKVNFGTSYTADANNPKAPSSTLASAVQQNYKEIPPIQEKNIVKANINAQMLLFSGFKVPYSVKAAKHQENAMLLLSENERMSIINQVIITYDKLAVIYQSEEVLNNTAKFLEEQKRFVEKAYSNGMVIDLNRQKIDLACRQLDVRRIELEANRKILYSRIEELTGYPSDSVWLLKPELKPWLLPQINGSGSDRPDIKALSEAILATNFKRKAEWSEYVPKVFVFGKQELIKSDLTMLDPQWYVGVGLRWTIFDGLTAQNNASQAKLDRIILENRKEEATELADLNLKKIAYDIEKNNKLLESTAEQVKLALEIMNLSKKQFEQGLISMNEHLSSVTEYEKARLENIQAIAQERATVSDYLVSSGKLTIEGIQ